MLMFLHASYSQLVKNCKDGRKLLLSHHGLQAIFYVIFVCLVVKQMTIN